MVNVYREVVGALLGRVHARGLISGNTYSGAMDLLHSTADFPALLRDPACEEAGMYECAQDTQ